VTVLLIGSVLLAAVLGRFFKVLVLVPACVFVLAAMLVKATYAEHGLLRSLLEFAALIISLQAGYVVGLLSYFIPGDLKRQGKSHPRASSPRPTAATRHQ
jgi:hypothetical protein